MPIIDAFIVSRLISPRPAREEELSLFHSEDYLECLKRLSNEEDEEKHGADAEVYGLSKIYFQRHFYEQPLVRRITSSLRS